MTPSSWHEYAARALERRRLEREEDEEDRRLLEEARARYEGLDWRAISKPLDGGER